MSKGVATVNSVPVEEGGGQPSMTVAIVVAVTTARRG